MRHSNKVFVFLILIAMLLCFSNAQLPALELRIQPPGTNPTRLDLKDGGIITFESTASNPQPCTLQLGNSSQTFSTCTTKVGDAEVTFTQLELYATDNTCEQN